MVQGAARELLLREKMSRFLVPCDDASIRGMGRTKPRLVEEKPGRLPCFTGFKGLAHPPWHLEVDKQSRFLPLGLPGAHEQ